MKRTRKSAAQGGATAAVKRARDVGEDEPGNGDMEAVALARQPSVSLSKEEKSRLPIRCVFRIEVVREPTHNTQYATHRGMYVSSAIKIVSLD